MVSCLNLDKTKDEVNPYLFLQFLITGRPIFLNGTAIAEDMCICCNSLNGSFQAFDMKK